MKKFFTLMVALFVVASVSAQENFKNKVGAATGSEFTFGPKVGLNLSNVHNSEMNTKASVHVGGFAEFRFNSLLALQAEILYSRMGASDKEDGTKVKYRVNYLTLPVLAKFYVWRGLSLEAGPQLDFVLNGKAVVKKDDTTVKHDIDNLNTVGLTLAIGAAYDLGDHLFVGARYNLGLTNVMDKEEAGANNQSRGFQISVGWRF